MKRMKGTKAALKLVAAVLMLAFVSCLSGMSALSWAGNNAGGAFSAWPDTGQERCYDNSQEIPCPDPGEPFYGQDAQYQGPVRSYTKLGYGGVELPDSATPDDGWIMTKDNVTGLIWEVKTDDGSIHDKDNLFLWCDTNYQTNGGYQGNCGADANTEAFINYLNAEGVEGFGGFFDWRVPTVKELSTLLNSNIPYPGPTINTAYFPNTGPSRYWSSTTWVSDNYNAWRVSFGIFGVSYGHKPTSNCYVRAVRGGNVSEQPQFVDNNDGTVTDRATGLMWQKCTMGGQWNDVTGGCDGKPEAYIWENALLECEDLDFAGYDDWRLPDCQELHSIVNYYTRYPAINWRYFLNTVSGCYWSSTTTVNYPISFAWRVDFGLGDVVNGGKTSHSYVRCVRGEQHGLFVNLIVGYIRDSGTDNPVSGAAISADTGRSTTSALDGSYRLGFKAPGLYDLTVSKSGYQTITVENVQVNEDEVTTMDIYLTKPGYTISGRVSRYGAALEGVGVDLTGSVTKHCITGADGTYYFDHLLDGMYHITPTLDGHEFDPATRSVNLSGAGVSGQDFDAVTTGDADQDADVDGVDLWSLADTLANSGYDPALDLNHDSSVNEKDVEMFAARFGK